MVSDKKQTALYNAVVATDNGKQAVKRVLDYVGAGGTPNSGGVHLRRCEHWWELVGPENGPVFRGTLGEATMALVNMAGAEAVAADINPDIPICLEV